MTDASGEEAREAAQALQPLREKVAALFRDCGKDGWDSYGAGAFTPAAVHAAAKNLADHLFPTVNAGVMFEWDTTNEGPLGRGGLVLEFNDEGHLVGFYASDGTAEVEWDVDVFGGTAREEVQ